jgi:hypothetical protein
VSCRVVSCLVFLSCLVLSCLALPCLVLSCLVLSCLVLSCLASSCLVLSCLALSMSMTSLCWKGNDRPHRIYWKKGKGCSRVVVLPCDCLAFASSCGVLSWSSSFGVYLVFVFSLPVFSFRLSRSSFLCFEVSLFFPTRLLFNPYSNPHPDTNPKPNPQPHPISTLQPYVILTQELEESLATADKKGEKNNCNIS